ncbi:MAG: FliM/FliN family flagellar motor switch protein [Phycisphaerales bacterium]|nr:FliM/FliN family flagellar motor switch protein [Phycisphaerales bacterium]
MDSELQRILALEVPVIVKIGERTLSVREVMSLKPGSIMELPKPCEDELELCINNKVLGSGVAVKVGENFGIRITYLGDITDRVGVLSDTPDDGDADSFTELARTLLEEEERENLGDERRSA